MKNQKMWKGFVIGLCLSALTGCGTGAEERTGSREMQGTDGKHVIFDDRDSTASEGDYTDQADGNGSREGSSLPDGNGTDGADASRENQDNTIPTAADEKVDAESLYAAAVITGSVVEFTDDSCTISPVVKEDGGNTGVIAAPGHESEDTNVVVTYEEGCVVQIATIYTSTGEAELEQANISDIKKQASVIIYGSFEDTHHISANKIIICHRTA